MKAGEFYEEQKVFDAVVWGVPEVRDNVEALRELRITTPTGALVPLREVADIIIAPTPNQITREAASRYTEVTCNVRGRDLGSVARDIEKKVSSVHFERG
ncbi:MAG: efflux RND transporter permease subunit, partial [bacterium]